MKKNLILLIFCTTSLILFAHGSESIKKDYLEQKIEQTLEQKIEKHFSAEELQEIENYFIQKGLTSNPTWLENQVKEHGIFIATGLVIFFTLPYLISSILGEYPVK